MTSKFNAQTGCLLVGEYVDEGECPPNVAVHQGEVVRPQVVANYCDNWEQVSDMKEFSVLLKDGRVAAVRGHGLKHESHSLARQDVFSIVVRSQTEEVLVALFKSADVAGIFCGDLRVDRKIAN